MINDEPRYPGLRAARKIQSGIGAIVGAIVGAPRQAGMQGMGMHGQAWAGYEEACRQKATAASTPQPYSNILLLLPGIFVVSSILTHLAVPKFYPEISIIMVRNTDRTNMDHSLIFPFTGAQLRKSPIDALPLPGRPSGGPRNSRYLPHQAS